MEFNFVIKNDMLVLNGQARCVTGNVNSYVCNFEILTNSELMWMCVFRQGENAYRQVIENGKCVIPEEVLVKAENVQVGCYAAGAGKRISTNWIEFSLEEGAYTEATMPKEPTPDVWETLVMKAVPYISDNGNWYVYNKEMEDYVDSGMPAKGETPQKGIDYWTEEDKAEIKSYVDEQVAEFDQFKSELETGLDNIIAIQNELMGVSE